MSRTTGLLPTPSTYTRLLLQRWPLAADTILQGTGLVAAELPGRASISADQQLRVFRNAGALSGRADWALDFGQQLNITSHGPLGFAALSAPTLGEGLDIFGRFARIRAPYVGFTARETEEQLVLAIDTAIHPLADLERPIVEIVLQVACSYIDAVIGLDAIDVKLSIRDAPPSYAERYPKAFRVPCHFNADYDGVALPAALKGLPCPLHDEKTYRASVLRCREALDAVLSPDDVVARASHWLATHFDQIISRDDLRRTTPSLPQLDHLASALCVSPRTLIRQLRDAGTSFSELRNAQQLEIACKLLTDARYTAGEIGLLLGYGDAANFGRAFRRMTGIAPGQYRRGER